MASDDRQRFEDWTEPGAYEVAHGVYRIPLPLPNDGLRAVNVYAITDTNSLTLVDSGWALVETRNALQSALNSLGAELGDVEQFLVTHVHRDHYTQAVALRREYGTPVNLGEGERPAFEVLNRPDFQGHSSRFAMLQSHDAGDVVENVIKSDVGRFASKTEWETPDYWLFDHQEIELHTRKLRVVNTPGHTRGHVVFVDEVNGLLFAGDHVLPHITPSIGFEAAPTTYPLENYLESLRKVRLMPEMKLLPAHGPVMPGVHKRVDEILAHHDDRLAKVFGAVVGGASTAAVVARRITWTGRERPFDTLDPTNQMLAVLETVAHLDLLTIQGRLLTRFENGVNLFEPAFDGRHST